MSSNGSSGAQERMNNVVNHLVPSQTSAEKFLKEENGITLESLFNYSRFSRPLTLFDKAIFALYTPIGVTLMVVRFVLFVIIMSSGGFFPGVISRSAVPWLIRRILGFFITVRNRQYLDEASAKTPPIFVANHITDFDTYVIPMVIQNARPVISARVKTIPILGPLMSIAYSPWSPVWVPIKVQGTDLRVSVREDIESHYKKGNRVGIAILAEGGLTNGKVGTMIFKKFVFGLGLPVLPFCIKYKCPLPINPDWLGTSWLANILWGMFIPWHSYELTFLPPMTIKQGETDTDFAKRVQIAVSSTLGIAATNFVYEQKVGLRVQTHSSAWKN